MLIDPAWAQAAPMDGPGILVQLAPFLLIFVIMYFLLIRPQQKRMKAHKEMISAVRKGDVVVTSGGIIGKVVKVQDDADEATVEIAKGVEIKVVKSTLADVRARTEPGEAKQAG
ncbi:MAG TPA: preprotein translocase subunit YajC [Micropepsaceae bacterium]|nr:preprotein translocase subunit YajC [Micropepsaceae bacterium]